MISTKRGRSHQCIPAIRIGLSHLTAELQPFENGHYVYKCRLLRPQMLKLTTPIPIVIYANVIVQALTVVFTGP